MERTIEEQLLERILERYKSARSFANSIGMPTSTLDSVLKRGIKNSSFCAVMTIFRALDFDIESAGSGVLTDSINVERQPAETDGLSQTEVDFFSEFRKIPDSHKGLAASLCTALIRELVKHQTIEIRTEVSSLMVSSH